MLKVAHEDPRVKLCALLDPWLYIYHKEILSGELALSIPVIQISTELFIPYCEGFFPQWDTIKALFRHSAGKRHENIVLKGTDHKHQCDVACLLPFEMFAQALLWPQTTTNETYKLTPQLVLDFMARQGFGEPSKAVREFIDPMVSKWVLYDIRCD